MISSKKSPKIHNQLIRLFKTKIVNSTNLSFLSKVNKSKQQSPEGPKFNKNTDTISDNKQLKEAHLTSTLISIQNLPRVTRGEQTCNLLTTSKDIKRQVSSLQNCSEIVRADGSLVDPSPQILCDLIHRLRVMNESKEREF